MIFFKKVLIPQLILVFSLVQTSFSADYTWSSFLGSTNWNSNLNWAGGPTVPGPGDNVTITGLVVNSPTVPAGGVTINNFTIDNGAVLGQGINCNGQTLTITGIAQFNGATATAGNIICTGPSVDFNGTTFNASVTATCGTILLNGSVFNSTVDLTKTGATNDDGDGGNEFNGALTITNSGTGIIRTGILAIDEFNNTVIVTNSNTGRIVLADNTGTTDFTNSVILNNSSSGSIFIANGATADAEFQGTVEINNSGTGAIRFADFAASNVSFLENFSVSSTANGFIYFGENGGTANLANTKTITIGAAGFNAGTVSFKSFTQTGATAQNIPLTGTANINILSNSIFNANLTTSTVTGTLTITGATFNSLVNATCGRIFLKTSIFNDATIFTKTSIGSDDSFGSNTFNDQVIFRCSGPGDFNLAATTFDTYNDSTIVINASTGSVSIATGSSNHSFNGVSLVNNSTGSIYMSKLAGAASTVNGSSNVKMTNTGNIYISENATSATTFNENITFENTSSGTIYTGNSGGTTNLASNKTVSIGASGFIGGNLILNKFIQNSGLTQTLALTSSGSLTIGPSSIFNGRLNASTINGTVTFNTATFIDTTIVSSGGFILHSNSFSEYSQFISSGSGTYTSIGGNTFNDITEMINNGTGSIQLANTTIDVFNDSLYANNSQSGTISFAHNAATSFNELYALNINSGEIIIGNQSSAVTSHNDIIYLENTSSGTINLHKESGSMATFSENIYLTNTGTGGINFGINGGTGTLISTKLITPNTTGITAGLVGIYNFTQLGVTDQSIITTSTGSLTIGTGSTFNAPVNFNVANTLTMANATFNDLFTSTSSSLFTGSSTYNGVTTMDKTGASNDNSTGSNTFNDSLEVNMLGSGTLRFANSAGDDYNGFAEFHWVSGQLEPCYTGINTFNGNIWIDGALTMDIPSTMKLDGNNQTITMTGVDSAYIETLDMSTATGTVTTIGHIILPNPTSTLALGAAILDLNGYDLRIHNSINTTFSRTTGFILTEQTDNSSVISWDIGSVTDAFTFPIGNANGTYIPFTIAVTAGDIGTFSLSTYGTPSNNQPYPVSPDVVQHVYGYYGTQMDYSAGVIDRFWQLDKTGAGTTTITFSYDELEMAAPNNITEANLNAQRWNSITEDWDPGVGSVNVASNTVTATGVSNFSPWVLVDNNSPLPVSWMDFSVTKTNNDQAQLFWATASEHNNDFFTIESAIRIESPKIIDYVDGSGTTNKVHNYQYKDNNTSNGISYYRVKQTDFDGNSSYTEWKSINVESKTNALVHFEENNIVVTSMDNISGLIKIYSIDGKIIGSGILEEEGQSMIPISYHSTGVVVYSIEFENGVVQNGKLLKN